MSMAASGWVGDSVKPPAAYRGRSGEIVVLGAGEAPPFGAEMVDFTTLPSPGHSELCFSINGDEIIRLNEHGDVHWRGRLVDSDDGFRAMMRDLYAALGRKSQ
jgi:hypothetical protein